MSKKSAKGAVITVSGTDISASCVSYEISDGLKAEDVTGFGESVNNNILGQRDQSVTLDVLFDNYGPSGALSVLNALVDQTTPYNVTVKPATGEQTFTLSAIMDGGIKVTGESKGSPIKMGSIKFVPGSANKGTWA